MGSIMLERSGSVKPLFRPFFSEATRSILLPLLEESPSPFGERAASVTAALGFHCTDGVVLAADTQMTIPNILKYRESKIRTFEGLRFRPFFLYAGNDVAFTKSCIRRLAERLKATGMTNHLTVMRAELKAISDEYAKRYRDPAAKGKYLLSLVAIQAQNTVFLYQINGEHISAVSRPCTTIGLGEDVAATLSGFLYPRQLSVLEASFAAAYMLGQMGQHVDMCNEHSQILKIYPLAASREWPVTYDLLTAAERRELADGYERIQAALRPLLMRSGDALGLKDAEFDKALKQFVRTVRREKKHRGTYMGLYERMEHEGRD